MLSVRVTPGRPAPISGWWQNAAAGIVEGLLTGILAGLGSVIAVAIGVAITVATIHDPNLTPPGQHPILAGLMAFAVVPIAIFVTLARRSLRQPASATSGAIMGFIAGWLIVPPMVSLNALPPYFAYIGETVGPKGPFPADVIQYSGVGPSWLAPGIFLALFVVSGVFGAIAGRSFEPRIARLRGAIQSTLLYVVTAAIGLIGAGALLWLYLGPVILGGE